MYKETHYYNYVEEQKGGMHERGRRMKKRLVRVPGNMIGLMGGMPIEEVEPGSQDVSFRDTGMNRDQVQIWFIGVRP